MKSRHGLVQTKMLCSSLVAVLLAVLLAFPVSAAYATPTATELQAEAQATLASLNTMQSQLNELSVAYDEALLAQQDAEAKRSEAQVRIDEVTLQITDLQERLGSRARSMYRTGNASLLDLLFGSTTFQQFATNWDILLVINEDDAQLIEESKNLQEELSEQETILAQQESRAAEAAQTAMLARDDASATVASMQATYDSLSAEALAALEVERAAEEAARAAQAQEVVDRSAEEANTAQNNSDASSGSTSNPSSGSTPQPDYNEPIAGSVVDRAASQLGKPYGWGGVGPASYDCSGFVSFCLSGSYSRIGTTYTFLAWPQVSNPQPGDVCVSAGHCGIYVGNGQMIHAATYGVGVVYGAVQSDMIIVRSPW